MLYIRCQTVKRGKEPKKLTKKVIRKLLALNENFFLKNVIQKFFGPPQTRRQVSAYERDVCIPLTERAQYYLRCRLRR